MIVASQAFPIQRPTLKVGDQWTIERRDPFTKITQGTTQIVITTVGEQRVEATFNGLPGVLTLDLTGLDNGTVENDVGYELLRFPLEASSKWEFKTNWKNRKSGNSGTSEFKVSVAGTESLTVQAGTFETVKLRANGSLTSPRFPGKVWQTKLTYWYAPVAKRIVRFEWHDQYKDLDYDEELVKFQFAE
jgi:hypothetical protein